MKIRLVLLLTLPLVHGCGMTDYVLPNNATISPVGSLVLVGSISECPKGSIIISGDMKESDIETDLVICGVGDVSNLKIAWQHSTCTTVEDQPCKGFTP